MFHHITHLCVRYEVSHLPNPHLRAAFGSSIDWSGISEHCMLYTKYRVAGRAIFGVQSATLLLNSVSG